MKFLFPGFLFALSAVFIPVLIHLFNFRKFKKVYFSNVSFLKQIDQKTSSARQLKNLLLLALRILAIIFLVLAFAKPYIPRQDSAIAFEQQAISVYIDNSYSMETLNREGTLLDEAKRRAKELASAYGINDRFQLITNDFEGRHQRLLNYEDFIAAVDEVKISGTHRKVGQVLNRQLDVFSGEPNSKKTVYLISDFQSNMLDLEKVPLDTAVDFRLVQLAANPLPNISVDSVWFLSPIHRPGEQERLVIQLKNNSDKRAESVPLKLIINGRQKAIASLAVAARASRRDTLSFGDLPAGWQKGELSITDYPMTFDDRFFFTFYVEQRMKVLAINERGPNPYIEAVYRAEPFFELINTDAGNINYASLGTYPYIILNSVSNISAGLAGQLKLFVQNGGSLLITPALTEDLSGLTTLNQALGLDVPEALETAESKVSSINLQHPLFKGVFEQLPRNMDLPLVKKFVRFSSLNRTTRQPILQLPGGRSLLSQYSLGKGRVFLSAVPLNEEASNIVRHSVFVPIMYQSAFLSLRDSRLFYIIGKDQFLESSRINLGPNQALKLKKENFEAIPDLRQNESGSRLFIADQIREQGIYNLLKADSLQAVYAFNDNRSESDLTYASENDLENKFGAKNIEIFKPGRESIQDTIKASNYGIQLWKLCLILALIFLAAEIFVIRFYKNRGFQKKY